jgi:hypothetical protein
MDRVERLLDAEAERFRSLVLAGAPDPSAASALRAAGQDLEQARRASAQVSRPAAPPPAPLAPQPKISWWRRAFG